MNAGELLSDFMMAKNDASQRFTDSIVQRGLVAVLDALGVQAAQLHALRFPDPRLPPRANSARAFSDAGAVSIQCEAMRCR